MLYIVILLLLTVLAGIFVLFVKIRRIDENTWDLQIRTQRKLDNQFKQQELLQNLYLDLGFDKSLPSTRGWAGSPDFLCFLANHTLENTPKVVIECSSGVSTIIIAKVLEKLGAGHIYSLEHDPVFAEKTRAELEKHNLEKWASVIHAPLVSTNTPIGEKKWYSLDNLPDIEIDLLVIDGPPEFINPMSRYPAGPQLIPRLRDNATIILDDADRPDEKSSVELWTKEFTEFSAESFPCEKGLTLLTNIHKSD